MHVDLTTLIGKGFDQIGFAGGKLAVHLTHPSFIDRYLMKITRPQINSDVNLVHADVSSFDFEKTIGDKKQDLILLETSAT